MKYIIVVGLLFLMGCSQPHGFWFVKGDHLVCPEGHIVYMVDKGEYIDGMRCKICGQSSAAFFPRVASEEEIEAWRDE